MNLPLSIAVCCDPCEVPAWRAAVELLNASLDRKPPIALHFVDTLAHLAESGASLAAASLLPATADPGRPWPELRQTWLAACLALRDHFDQAAFLTTVFRHLAPVADDPRRSSAALTRLRRVNLMAAELSQETGVSIIDLDQVLADIGGQRLCADAWLWSPAAIIVAAETIAGTLLTCGLDTLLDDATLLAARDRLRQLRTPAPAPLAHLSDLRRVTRGGTGRAPQAIIGRHDLLDDRSVRELVNDVFRGRMPLLEAAPQLLGKVTTRLRRAAVREA